MEQSYHKFLDKIKARLDRNGRNSLCSSMLTPTRTIVSVNVYDMLWLNVYTNSLGIGVYHTGVVIYGTEYCYGGHPFEYSGIFAMAPQDTETLGPNYSYKTTINLGWTDFTESEVSLILEDMGPQYRGDQYHLLHKNCNHFSDAFVQILCGASLPKWINRLASVGAKLPFVERSIPKLWLTPRPLEDLNSLPSEQAGTNTDTASFSSPVLVSDDFPNDATPSSKRRPSALFSRMLSRRWNHLERPSSTVSFRNLIRLPRDRSLSVTNSLVDLVDSRNNRATIQPTVPTQSTTTCQLSTHSRPHEGDNVHLSAGDPRAPVTSEEPERGESQDGGGGSSTPSNNQHRDSLINRSSNPISSLLMARCPQLTYAPSSNSPRSTSSNKSFSHQCDVLLASPSSPQHPETTLHTSPCVLDQQPIAIQQHPRDSSQSKDSVPVNPLTRRDNHENQSGANYTQIFTSGLLSRLQNLCGTTEQQLHDPNRPSSPFDSDTNSLANSAF